MSSRHTDSADDTPRASALATWRRLLRLPRRSNRQIAADVDDELAFHLAMREEELRARGLSASDAARQARQRFGDLETARHALRRADARTQRVGAFRAWSAALRHDVAYAARRAVREPLVTGVIVLTLAIGIGSTVTVASVVQRMLLAPLPYPGAERLVVIRRETRDGSLRVTASREMLRAFRETVPSLERVESVSSRRRRIERDGRAAMGDVGVVSQGLLDFLHVAPAAGRSFATDELTPAGNPVLMLSNARWLRDYAGSADAIGSTLTVDDRTYTIVGVMPRLFDPSVFGLIPKSEIWLPDVGSPDDNFLATIGVLRAGSRIDGLQRELDQAYARLAESERMQLVPKTLPLMELAGTDTRAPLLVMAAAVVLVLLIACMNVANLLLARGATRERELAVRTAIGASRARIVRQLLTESALLSLGGAVLGVLTARSLLALVAAWRPASYAALEDVRLDGQLFIFAVVLALGTAFLFGLVPALLDSRGSASVLQGGSRSVGHGRIGARTRRFLAFAEVGCSVALVVAAALLVRSASALEKLRLGYDVDALVTMRVQRAERGDRESAASNGAGSEARTNLPTVATLLAPVLERVRALPQVEALSVDESPPGAFGACMCELLLEGEAVPATPVSRFMLLSAIDSTYLPTAGTRLVAGRNVSGDTTAHEAIVTATAARRLWRGEPALGKRLRIARDAPLLTVVGVIEDQRAHDGRMVGDSVHLFLQGARFDEEPALLVRVRRDAAAAQRLVARMIEEGAPALRVIDAATLRQTVDEARAPQRFTRLVLIGFAACALLLAVVGLYGVMSYGVAQRTHEIGVRMALGAGRRQIGRLVLGEGLSITLAGVLAGGAGSLALGRLLDGMLLNVSARDPAAFVVAAATVVLAALLALWIPTRRALRVDPIAAVTAA